MKLRVGDKVYEFDQTKRMLNVELNAVEREIGMTPVEWQDALNRESSLALTALVWILKRRYDGNPGLRFADVVFDPDEVDIIPEPGEQVPEPGKSSTSASVPASPEVMNGTALNSSVVTVSVPGNVTDWKPATT